MGAQESKPKCDDSDDEFVSHAPGASIAMMQGAGTAPWYEKSFEAASQVQYSKSQTIGQKCARAGLRSGTRDTSGAEALYNQIPEYIRRSRDETRTWLKDKDASHITSHHNGGSADPGNIVWEDRSSNRARGKADMSLGEVTAIRQARFQDQVAFSMAEGAQTGAAAGCVFSALEDGKEYRRNKISGEEFVATVAKKTAVGAVTGAAAGAVGACVAAAAPATAAAVTPVLAAAGGAMAAGRAAYATDQLFAKRSDHPGMLVSEVKHEGFFTTEIERKGWCSTTIEKQDPFGTTIEKK